MSGWLKKKTASVRAWIMYKVGVIGCGYVSRTWHLPVYRQLKDVEVVAACDIDRTTVETFAKNFGIGKAFTDYKKLLEEELEVVDICLPPHLHASIAKEVAEHKLNVIVEKPLALSSNQAEEIIQTCNKNNVKLCAIEDFVFFPMVQKLKSLVEDDYLGSIISVNTVIRRGPLESGWRQDPTLSGGPLLEDGIHQMMLHVLFLKKIQTIYATVHDTLSVDQSIHYQVTLRARDTIGTMEACWGPGVPEIYLALFGSKYSARIDVYRNLLFTNDGSNFLWLDAKNLLKRLRYALKYIFNTRIRKNKLLPILGHYYQLKDFFESMKSNSEPALSGNLVKKGIMLIESAQKSIATGQEVKIMNE